MRFLFSHNNYPAQFRRLIPALIDKGHQVVFLCTAKEWHAPSIDGVEIVPFQVHRAGGGADTGHRDCGLGTSCDSISDPLE